MILHTVPTVHNTYINSPSIAGPLNKVAFLEAAGTNLSLVSEPFVTEELRLP